MLLDSASFFGQVQIGRYTETVYVEFLFQVDLDPMSPTRHAVVSPKLLVGVLDCKLTFVASIGVVAAASGSPISPVQELGPNRRPVDRRSCN